MRDGVLRRVMLPTALGVVVGCADSQTAPPEAAIVTRIDVFATDSAVLVGHKLQVQLVAWDSAGRVVVPPLVVWSSTDSSKLRVDSTGRVTAVAGGDAFVVARTAAPRVRDELRLHVAVHGEVKWRLSLGYMPVTGGAAEGPDGTLYVCTIDDFRNDRGTLYAISPRGVILWQRVVSEMRNNWPIVGPDGTVYVVGQYIWAFNPDGSLRWSLTSRPPDPFAAPDQHAGAVSADGVLYSAMGHDLLALRAATGDTVWVGPRSISGAWAQPPTVSPGLRTVYVNRSGFWLAGVDAATGTERWTRGAVDSATWLDMGSAGPVVYGQHIIMPNPKGLQEIDTSGRLIATTPYVGDGVSEPAIGQDGTLYLQGSTLKAFTGVTRELWRVGGLDHRYPYAPTGPALAEGGVLYLAAILGFYAVNVSPTGASIRWRFPANPNDRLVFIGAPLIGRDGTVYSFSSTTAGEEAWPSTDELFAFWEDKPPEPDSPWPMWRHDARRSGQASR